MTNKWTEKAHTTIYCTYCGTAAEKHKKAAGYSEENGKPLFMVVDVCPNYGEYKVPRSGYYNNPHLKMDILHQFEEEEIKDIEFVEAE